jgi:hypothetical protein
MWGETISLTGREYVEAFSCSDDYSEPRYDRVISRIAAVWREVVIRNSRNSIMRENQIDAFRKNKASFVLSASRTTECRRPVRDAIASTLHVRERDDDRKVDVVLIDGASCR